MPETTELSLEERVARLEQEVAELKQAKPRVRFSEPPRLAFLLLREALGINRIPPEELPSFEEARCIFSEDLPENWASREIIRMREEE